jgi:predicted glycosyltransferase involved in capsule biosynthesis
MILMSTTPYVAIWDADAITSPSQIIDSVIDLRRKKAIISFPFDGRFYSCDKFYSEVFKKYNEIDLLFKNIPMMQLMHGFHSVGGALIVDKKEYLSVGAENQKMYGWGLEDAERIKRLETLSSPISFSKGPLFHLWHPRSLNSRFANSEIETQNRLEFLKTCSKNS